MYTENNKMLSDQESLSTQQHAHASKTTKHGAAAFGICMRKQVWASPPQPLVAELTALFRGLVADLAAGTVGARVRHSECDGMTSINILRSGKSLAIASAAERLLGGPTHHHRRIEM